MSYSAEVFNTPVASAIPSELRELNQWVCWKYEDRNGKTTKPPLQAKSNGKLLYARSDDPATWSAFDAAVAAAVRLNLAGVGLNLWSSDGLTGLDLDHVIDPATGELNPLAREVLERFAGTYTEISPSGTGIRIFCYGKPEHSGKCSGKVKWLEVYSHPSHRYLTVTGNPWPGSVLSVTNQQDALDWLHTRFMDKDKADSTGGEAAHGPSPVDSLDDAALLDKARHSQNGDAFDALWSGDTSAHNGDHSAADLALLNTLAFWTGKDSSRMDHLFRQSGLMRPKWDVVHDGERTYGEMSIDRAINDCREVYSGKKTESARHSDKKSSDTELKTTTKGHILPSVYNLSVILEKDDSWKGVIAYNDFRQRIEKRIDPPYKGSVGDWMDKDTVETRVWLDKNKDVNFSKGDIDQVVMMVAHRKAYNPAQDALRAMADQWDGQSRINSWLVDYLNAECDDSNRVYLSEIGSCWLKGVAARVLTPGCKRDDVLVLKGDQGFRKSTAASVIADAIHPNSFTDTLPDLKSEEVKLALHGMIIVEFAELAAINKSEIEVIKNFVTSQVDHVRGKYAHYYGDYKRTVSFIGTTNDETFLKDPTGNRRWWPVKITRVIDTDLLRSVIRQLLGEAAHRVMAGEPWHVTNLEAHRQAEVIRQDSFQDDVWKEDCLNSFHRLESQLDHIQTADILREMGIKIEQHSKLSETRINQIMRSSGYEYKQVKRNGVNKKSWIPLLKVRVSSNEKVTGYRNEEKTSIKTTGYPGYPVVSSTLESFKEKEGKRDGEGDGEGLGSVSGKEYKTEDTQDTQDTGLIFKEKLQDTRQDTRIPQRIPSSPVDKSDPVAARIAELEELGWSPWNAKAKAEGEAREARKAGKGVQP